MIILLLQKMQFVDVQGLNRHNQITKHVVEMLSVLVDPGPFTNKICYKVVTVNSNNADPNMLPQQ